MEAFIHLGIFVTIIGTLLSGIFSLFVKRNSFQRIAQIGMLIALVIGAVSSGVFLVNGFSFQVIWESNVFPGGKLSMDQLSAFFFFLVNAVGLFSILYGMKYILNEKGHYNIAYLQFLSALFLFGMQIVLLAETPIFFMFAWEIMSFASFLLVIADMQTKSIKPALFYLVITHLGALAILAGFLFLSEGILTIDFSSLADLAVKRPMEVIIAAFLLFFFGFGSKAGLFPFHGWLPEAHPQAPSHISALMSGVMLKIAVYGMLRALLFLLPPLPAQFGYAVVIIGLFSAILGVFYSVIETDMKRILAFSSIENLGLIFSMIGIFMVAKNQQMPLLAEISLIAALYQSMAHALFKSGLFLTAGIAGQTFHTQNIEKMGGMAKYMKIFSFAVLLLIISAAALPPSGPFIGEWLFIQSIINTLSSATFPFKVLLLTTLVSFSLVAGMAVFSMVRFFGIGFLAESRSPDAQFKKEPHGEMLLSVFSLAIISFLFGLVAKPLINLMGENLTSSVEVKSVAHVSNPLSFDPIILFIIITGLAILVWLSRRALSDIKNERKYHTWDCGQSINASMEYTATAFSAPIRFFFHSLIRAQKKVSIQQMTESNPWLVRKKISIEINPVWDQYFYNPTIRLIAFAATSIRKLQNGNIQFYLTLIFISLIVTAIVFL